MVGDRRALYWRIGAATIVLLIAAAFRFYRLGDYPLGIFFDPAINGLDSVRLLQRGGHVIFFPTNGGREAFFMYLLMPFIWLFGTTPFAIRFLTASLSWLTVALLFISIYDLRAMRFGHNATPARNESYLPFIASLVLATMYWPISVSRLGQRPILVPLLAVLIFWLFLKGWSSNRRRWFLLAGLYMGLAGHTYSAARLLPVILILSLIPELFSGSTTRLKKHYAIGKFAVFLPDPAQLANLGVFLLAALGVYAPMAWYLVKPSGAIYRTGRVGYGLEFSINPGGDCHRTGAECGAYFCLFLLPGKSQPDFRPSRLPWLVDFADPFPGDWPAGDNGPVAQPTGEVGGIVVAGRCLSVGHRH
jgi:hypothetical protein